MQSRTIGAAGGESQDLSRRTFLRLTSGAALTGVFGVNLSASLVYADALGKEKRDKMTPDEILAAFKRGNKNFSKGLKTSRNYLSEQKATAKGQYPVGGRPELHRLARACRNDHGSRHRRYLQRPRRRQHRQRRHPGQHGIFLQSWRGRKSSW